MNVAELLLEKGFYPNERGPDGNASLHYAAYHGIKEVVQLLLEQIPM